MKILEYWIVANEARFKKLLVSLNLGMHVGSNLEFDFHAYYMQDAVFGDDIVLYTNAIEILRCELFNSQRIVINKWWLDKKADRSIAELEALLQRYNC